MHTLLQVLLLSGLFAAISFLVLTGIRLFTLEFDPVELRRPLIHVICLATGFYIALVTEFVYLSPRRRPLLAIFLALPAIFGGLARMFRRIVRR